MPRGVRRRELIGGLAAAAAGCSRRRAKPSLVTIARARSYSEDLAGLLRTVLMDQKLDVRGKKVLLKPNLVEFDAATAINTHPALVLAALETFHAMGAAEVRIAEGPGHRRITLELAEEAGYFRTIPGFEDVFTDLNLDDVSEVRLARPHSRLRSLHLPHTALRCDLLVSMPKMKTHHWVGATLGMKNLFGLVPGAVYGWPKNVLHWAGIPECVADLNRLFPRQFAIVDGIVGMEGNGPIQGTPKHAGVIVAGRDMAAVDATCCRIMGIDPLQVPYLRLAGLEGIDILHAGEAVGAVRTDFQLIPQFRELRLS